MWIYYLMVFLFALQRHWLWSMQLSGTITLFKILGTATLAYALFFNRGRRYSIPFRNRTTAIFVALFMLAAFSYLTQGATPQSSAGFQSYVSMISLIITTFLLVDSWERLHNTLRAILVGVAFGGLYVIREYQLYQGRPGWVVGNPNTYAAAAAICLPLGIVLLDLEKRRLHRLAVMACLLITGSALVLTGSRGGFLAVFASFAFIFWRSRQWRRPIAYAGSLLLLIVMVSPISPLERLLEPSAHDDSSVEHRKRLITAGLEMVGSNPIMGVGLGNFKIEAGEFDEASGLTAHNTYIEVAAELGLPALLLFLGLTYVSWKDLNRAARSLDASSQFQGVVTGLQGSLVGFMVAGLFITAQYQRYFWLIVLLSTVMAVLSEREARSRSPVKAASAEALRAGPFGHRRRLALERRTSS